MGSGRVGPRIGLPVGAAVLSVLLGSSPALAGPPSTKIGTAPLISPSAANTYFTSLGTASSNTTGETGRPKEIVELARALKGSPDLIYEHVRNNAETVWTYGLTKGAMGVIVDRAGTAFDQTQLMVELLRESGYLTYYRLGTITLTGAQFESWSGITSATAACQLLSSGGIPAVINGTTLADCSYGAATVTTIQMSHAWVQTAINGVAYVFDPSFKPHTFKPGLDLATATGMTAGAVMSATNYAPVTESGVDGGVVFSTGTVKNRIETYAAALETHLAANAPAAGLEDVVGGQEIVPQAIPAGGLRQTSLPYTYNTERSVTGGMLDAYRTRLQVTITKARPGGTTTQIASKLLAVDQIYGRRLVFDPNFDTTGASFTGALKVVDEFGAATSLASVASLADDPTYSRGEITLSVNMPYAANAGAYMDAVVARPVSYALPFTIVHGWGETGRGLIDKWGSRRDSAMPAYTGPDNAMNYSRYKATKGDGRRELLAASWLAQASRAGQIHASIAKGIFAQHYAVGISAADTAVQMNTPGVYWVTDSFDRLDVETGFSLTSKGAVAADRRAAVLAAAATISNLKGSVSAQIADMPDVSTVATRLEWGNAPDALMDPVANGYGRRVYQYDTTTQAANALALSVVENRTSSPDSDVHYDGNGPPIGAAEALARRQQLANAIGAYAGAGFKVTAGAEALLGPGKRAGAFYSVAPTSSGYLSHLQTSQRGGAISATRYDANGDPLEIAHVLVNPEGIIDGGGGGTQTYHQNLYDPALSADVVEGLYINPQPGTVVATSPAKLVVGSGGFPYALPGELSWRAAPVRDETHGVLDHHGPQGGWTSNWNNSLTLSGSGLAVMDKIDARASLGTIAAFYAAQDVYRSAPGLKREVIGQLVNAWWLRSITGNVATVSVGTSTRQFVRKANGDWLAPGAGAYETLTQSGSRAINARHCYGEGRYRAARGWGYDGISFTLTGSGGDVQSWGLWTKDLTVGASSCAEQHGFRLNSWTWPSGVALTFNYTPSHVAGLPKLDYVTNNLSQRITLVDGGLGGFRNIYASPWLRQVSVAGGAGAPVTHTDPIGAVTKYEMLNVGTGDYARPRLDKIYAADDGANPATQYVYDTLARLKETRDKIAIAGAKAPNQLLLADGLRTETIDALGASSASYADRDGRPSRVVSALGAISRVTYDGKGRPLSIIGSMGDRLDSEYNVRNQIAKQTLHARLGSAEAGQTLVTEASWNPTWNQPAWSKDAKGAQTDYSYSSGQLYQTTYPAGLPGQTRDVEYASYYPTGQTMNLNSVLGRSLGFTYNNVSVASLSSLVSNQTASYTTTADTLGDPIKLTKPRGGVIDITYNVLRRPILEVEPLVGTAPRNAKRTTYDIMGRVTKVERGTYVGTTFTPLETYAAEYDVLGQKLKDISPTGVVQYSYDPVGRLVCTAARLNPAVYDALPADACTPSAPGAFGPDRITRTTYDAAGQVVLEEAGVGTDLQQVTARYTYSAAGEKLSLTDANGNKSTFEYDGFGRLAKLRYPAGPRGSGLSSTTDYEAYGYDANGNRTSLRKRDGRVITYTYDARNRMTVKDLPDTTTADAYYAYSGQGRRIDARLGSATSTEVFMLMTDEVGRLIFDQPPGRQLDNTYDVEGNRTRVVYHTPGYTGAAYAYDVAGRLTDISYTKTSLSQPTWEGVLGVTYGVLNRPDKITRPNGVDTTYAYDIAGRLAGISHTGPNVSTPFQQTIGYNPLGQVLEQSQASAPYQWSGQPTTTTNFTHDALNRDAAVAAASGYDANGNLISDGTRSFTYDAENRLVSVTGGTAPVGLTYDPFGRLWKITVNGTTTTELSYNGSALAQEGDATGPLRLYIHGNGTDDPLVWVEGRGTAQSYRWFHKDRLGSVIGVSAGSMTPYAYGPYGEPQSWAGSRFRYTGQIAIPEAQLYHYKARAYDPMRGHFLQTDPIGYGDGPNMYAYVKGDPMNLTDPSGNGPLVRDSGGNWHDPNPRCSYGTFGNAVACGGGNGDGYIATPEIYLPPILMSINIAELGEALDNMPGFKACYGQLSGSAHVGETVAGRRLQVRAELAQAFEAAAQSGADPAGVLPGQILRNIERLSPNTGSWIVGGTSQADGNYLFGAVMAELGFPLAVSLGVGDVTEWADDIVDFVLNNSGDGTWGGDDPAAKKQIELGSQC